MIMRLTNSTTGVTRIGRQTVLVFQFMSSARCKGWRGWGVKAVTEIGIEKRGPSHLLPALGLAGFQVGPSGNFTHLSASQHSATPREQCGRPASHCFPFPTPTPPP